MVPWHKKETQNKKTNGFVFLSSTSPLPLFLSLSLSLFRFFNNFLLAFFSSWSPKCGSAVCMTNFKGSQMGRLPMLSFCDMMTHRIVSYVWHIQTEGAVLRFRSNKEQRTWSRVPELCFCFDWQYPRIWPSWIILSCWVLSMSGYYIWENTWLLHVGLHELAFCSLGVVSIWWWGVNLVRTSHAQKNHKD